MQFTFQMKFKAHYNLGRLADVNKTGGAGIQVQCFPLYSLLLALNQTRVDFFSLDVEGDELKVLKTIPYKEVDIKMLTVEFVHGEGGADSLRSFMGKNRYHSLIQIKRWDGVANDVIFRKHNFAYWKT